MLITTSILMGLLVLVSILPVLRIGHWTVRIFDFPRMQIAFITLIAFVLSLFVSHKPLWFNGLEIATLVALLHQLRWIFTYTPLHKKEVVKQEKASSNTQRQLSILSANVLMPNRQAPKLLALIEKYQPDIVLTLESNQWWENQLSVIEQDYPYSVKQPLENLYGMHLYSKLPLSDCEIRYQIQEDIPSIVGYVVLQSGERVRLYCLHPMPPSPTENVRSQERDAELILVGEEVSARDEPALVFGDLNDVAWSRSTLLFRRISRMMDPRIGRRPFSTFHAKIPFLRWPLDHIFHSAHFNLVVMETLPDIGSDHLPIHVVLQYNESTGNVNLAAQANAEDLEQAEETKSEVVQANRCIKVRPKSSQ